LRLRSSSVAAACRKVHSVDSFIPAQDWIVVPTFRSSDVCDPTSAWAGRGRVQGEIAFMVRALKRADRGAFLHDVLNDFVEN
jgi:hypothetical protein